MKDFVLYNGVTIPAIGLGTWQVQGEACYNACKYAIEAGYNHIDTAYVYENEVEVGKALIDMGVKREEIFITSKLPADIKTYDGAIEYFNRSLEGLKTDYLDLYLIHAPWPWSDVGGDYTEGNIECWKALIDLYNQKKIRAIGVSNFHVKDIEAITNATGFKPMVNQIRFFIGNTQENITKYCQDNDILIQAYSPLATGEMLRIDVMDSLVEKYNTTKAKLCIAYCLQRGCQVLPRSTNQERIKSNFEIDVVIDDEDMEYLNSLYHVASTRPLRS